MCDQEGKKYCAMNIRYLYGEEIFGIFYGKEFSIEKVIKKNGRSMIIQLAAGLL